MKNTIYLIIFLNLICFPILVSAISCSATPTIDSFPATWQGHYKGELQIYSPLGFQQSVEMQLEVSPTDSVGRWTWAITYGPDSLGGRRSYELLITDPDKGYYQIDEKNSIILDAHLLDNTLTSCFEVMGNLLIATYEKRDEEIIFTVVMSKAASPIMTGGEVMAGDTIPPVKVYPAANRQRAVLQRLK